MKILLLFFLCLILIFGTYLLLDYYGLLSKDVFTAKVIALEGSNILYLSNKREVLLAGVRIPEVDEVNFDLDLKKQFKNYIEGKTLKFKVILKKTQDYPLYDTVLAYLPDGRMVNDIILKEGMAFFDHGWYPDKRRFEKIEKEARLSKKGLWKNIDKYKIVYVSAKGYWEYHLPGCPDMKKVKPEERIDYYFQPPVIYFFRGPHECVLKKWGEKQKVNKDREK